MASSQYDLLLCSATLVSDRLHISELRIPGFGCSVLLCRDRMPRARVIPYVRDGYGAFRQHKFVRGCCDMPMFRVCGARQSFSVLSLYRNSDLDDLIYESLLTSMVAVRASFLFMGDMNDHHQEWLGSIPETVMVLLPSTLQLYLVVIS